MAERPCPPRQFGLAADDLDIDFARPDRPALVTALLAACTQPADSGHWWAQPVGARHRALLELLRATDQTDLLNCAVRCPSCGEQADLALPLGDVVSLPAGPAQVELTVGNRHLTLRGPTGQDLQRWHQAPPRTRAAALQALVLGGEVQPGDEDPIAAAMADADPLVAFSVQCACPECGLSAGHDVDLEALALRRLARRQHAVLHEVHQFAKHYGWTEAQVFEVAPSRRARYLALIEDTLA